MLVLTTNKNQHDIFMTAIWHAKPLNAPWYGNYAATMIKVTAESRAVAWGSSSPQKEESFTEHGQVFGDVFTMSSGRYDIGFSG